VGLSPEQLESVVQEAEELVPRRDRAAAQNRMPDGTLYGPGGPSATEFLRNLQGALESVARRERRQALLRALAKFAEALRIEGD
jgi:hypothetical protein